MPIKDVGFNPEIILRRFYKIGVNFSENAIFKKMPLNRLQGKIIKKILFSDLGYQSGHKKTEIC